MRVKTKRKHENSYGDAYEKAVGTVYDHPNPGVLIKRGLVEKSGADDGGTQRVPRSGPIAKRTGKGSGQKRAAKGSQGRAGADGGLGGSKGADALGATGVQHSSVGGADTAGKD